MDFVAADMPVVAVCKRFLYEMSAVGRCVYEHVGRTALDTAFYYRFEIFILGFELFKRQIIALDDDAVIAVLYFGYKLADRSELVLIYFDNSQTSVGVFVEQSFDRRGFARAAVAVE